VLDEYARRRVFHENELARIAVATASMTRCDLTDVDIAEVDQSGGFRADRRGTRAAVQLLDFWQALRWLPANDPIRQRGGPIWRRGGSGMSLTYQHPFGVRRPASDEARTIRNCCGNRELADQEGSCPGPSVSPTFGVI